VQPRWISNTYDHQNWRRVGINGIIIANTARDRSSRLISCGEAERHRKVREGLGGSSGTCIGRGIRAGRAWEQARENGMERDAGEMDGRGGGEQVFMVVEKSGGA
jgi:hypothetical protein